MKETILITGAGPHGVTGKLIKERLKDEYNLLTPGSKDLDLTDSDAVDKYFAEHDIDYVIHSALSSPSRGQDSSDEADEVERNLRMYFNLAKHSPEFKKMFYFGSGAEFDKSQPIIDFKEDDAIKRMPKDKYGFVKYILNSHAEKSDNIYNLRFFGTINPHEPYTRNVVSNLCAKVVKGLPLKLNRNCRFSFIDIDDVIEFIRYGLLNELKHHSYNMIGSSIYLADLTNYLPVSEDIEFSNEGYSNEYTGGNERLKTEFYKLTPIENSINKVYKKIESEKDQISVDSIDNRWRK